MKTWYLVRLKISKKKVSPRDYGFPLYMSPNKWKVFKIKGLVILSAML